MMDDPIQSVVLLESHTIYIFLYLKAISLRYSLLPIESDFVAGILRERRDGDLTISYY